MCPCGDINSCLVYEYIQRRKYHLSENRATGKWLIHWMNIHFMPWNLKCLSKTIGPLALHRIFSTDNCDKMAERWDRPTISFWWINDRRIALVKANSHSNGMSKAEFFFCCIIPISILYSSIYFIQYGMVSSCKMVRLSP